MNYLDGINDAIISYIFQISSNTKQLSHDDIENYGRVTVLLVCS